MDLFVKTQLFSSKEEAIDHANGLGLWPISQILEEEENEENHWHEWDTHIYLIAGEFKSIDSETKKEFFLVPGDYMIMPKNRIHAMKSTRNTVVIYATEKPINFSKPVNLAPEALLARNA